MIKKIKFGLINLIFFKLSFAQSISELQIKYQKLACKILEKSYYTCFEASQRLNIFKNSDNCHQLSIEILTATIEEYKRTDEAFIGLLKRSSFVCYKACMGDDEILNNIKEECETIK